MARAMLAVVLFVKALVASLALVTLVLVTESRAALLENEPESKNVIEVERASKCSNPANSLEVAQMAVAQQALKPGWEKIRSIFILSPSMVAQVRELFFLIPTTSMAPRLREVVEKDTALIMIVYNPDAQRAIFVFVDENDCVLTHGPVDNGATEAMLDVLEIPR